MNLVKVINIVGILQNYKLLVNYSCIFFLETTFPFQSLPNLNSKSLYTFLLFTQEKCWRLWSSKLEGKVLSSVMLIERWEEDKASDASCNRGAFDSLTVKAADKTLIMKQVSPVEMSKLGLSLQETTKLGFCAVKSD